MANEFLESVANVEVYSASTGALLFTGLTNLSSTFTMSMDTAEVRGGQGNGLLYVYKHSRGIDVNIEQVTFSKDFLATNVGASIATASKDVYFSECITLDGSGDGTVTQTPVGSVYVQADSGSITTITPTGSDIAVPALASQSPICYYQYNESAVETITISAQETPDVVKLVLRAKVKNNSGVLTDDLQIEIPKFQVSGDYELSLSSDGISSESMSGMAIQYTEASCAGDIYGTFSWVPQSTSASYTTIYAVPSKFQAAVGDLPSTQQLTIYGDRGGQYDPVDVTDQCTFEMRASSDADITVSTTGTDIGLITIAGTGVATDEGFVDITLTVSSGTIEDNVHVLVTA